MSNIAVKRIHCDVRELNRNPSRQYSAAPLEDNLFEWHFTLRGPRGSDFQGGLYHGRILLPPQWPMKPPSIMFLNASGRFEVGKKVCLSATSFHPEHWQPAWGIRTILEALVAFFPTPADGALGALQWRPDERRKLALESQTWRCPCCGPIAELVEGGADERVLADGEAASAAFDAPVLPWDEGRAAAPAAAPEYSGHYVLLVGVDEAEGGFLIRDPARAEETDGTVVSVEALHAARRAHGTDEDLVIIPLDQRGDPRPPPPGTMPKVLRVLSEQWDSAAATTRPTSAERSTRGRLGQFSHSVPSDLSQMSLSSSSHPRALGLPQPSYRTSGRTERTSRVSERSCESDSD